MVKTRLLPGILVLVIILLLGISFTVGEEISQKEEQIKIIKLTSAYTFDPFLVFIILFLMGIFTLVAAFASKTKGPNKFMWASTIIGFLIGLINLYFIETRASLVYPIGLALKYLTNCLGPCWGLILYSVIITLLSWILIGLFVGIILKRILSTKNNKDSYKIKK